MAKLINLRRFKKTRARDEKRARGAENAARFGRSRAESQADTNEAERMARRLDGHRREGPTASGDDGGDDD